MSTTLVPPTDVTPPPRHAALREVALVLGLPTAVFVFGALMEVRQRASGTLVFSDASLLATLAIEGLLAALLLPWLWRRGWSPARVAGPPAPADVLRGAGTWFGAMSCMYLAYLVASTARPEIAALLADGDLLPGRLSPAMVVLASVWNPLFEEFLWLGYGVPALAPRVGVRGACAISVALRLAVHLYQGATVLVTVLPFTLFFTWYYQRTRRLWPVVVAHVIADAVALAAYAARA